MCGLRHKWFNIDNNDVPEHIGCFMFMAVKHMTNLTRQDSDFFFHNHDLTHGTMLYSECTVQCARPRSTQMYRGYPTRITKGIRVYRFHLFLLFDAM